MYKILLVDDEEMVIKSLKATVDWNKLGFEIAGYALSAEDALDMVETIKPDVVITDIKMPKFNGLELLQMLKAAYSDIHCIIISGYAEFAYIQKSIRLEAEGYCLKPFDAEEISVYLKRIKKNLDQAGTEEENKKYLRDYIQSSSAEALTYMNSFYKKKQIDFEDIDMYIIYILGMDKIENTNRFVTLNVGFQKYICFVREKNLEQILQEFDSSFNSIHMGVSNVITSFDKVPKAIREAKSCAYQYFCQTEYKTVYRYCEKGKDKSLIQGLERELENHDSGKIRKFILDISDKFMSGAYNIDYAVYLQNVYATWWSNQFEDKDEELIFDYDILCELFPSVFELLFEIESSFEEVNEKAVFHNNISNKTFKTIFDYIEKNYLKQMSITQLSEEFHINACYFSQLFKKEMGCTFTDYLAKRRIEYSCRLLLETDLKINQIAEISGFNDYFYYSRVFRKIKQCTPTEYRSN